MEQIEIFNWKCVPFKKGGFLEYTSNVRYELRSVISFHEHICCTKCNERMPLKTTSINIYITYARAHTHT